MKTKQVYLVGIKLKYILFFILSSPAWAQKLPPDVSPAQAQQQDQLAKEYRLPAGSAPAAPSMPSINDSSSKNQSGNAVAQVVTSMASGILTTVGTQFIVSCYSTEPPNAPLCHKGYVTVGMGVAAAIQSALHGDTSGKAGNAASMTSAGGSGYTYGNLDSADPYNPKNPKSPFYDDGKQQKINQANLAKYGVKADPTKGTLTVGDKTYKASDFSSESAMAKAGFSADEIAAGMAAAGNAEKAALAKASKLGALTPSNGYAEGGGSSGAGSSASEDDGTAAALAAAARQYGSLVNPHAALGLNGRDPSSVPSMQKNFNGDPIGVSVDGIFAMMSRRYKLKERQDAFLSEKDLLRSTQGF
ncbi:MAG: hypothetical protein ACOYOK_02560 [Pseudobdellovibrionaceae bacterium]